jgi:hypothetical protein
MKSYDVVGYTADADSYCVPCTHRIYGDDRLGTIEIRGREGNLIGPIFADSEWDYPLSCGSCNDFIDTNLTSDGIDFAMRIIWESLIEKSVTEFMMEVADSLLWMKLGKDSVEDERNRFLVETYIEKGVIMLKGEK